MDRAWRDFTAWYAAEAPRVLLTLRAALGDDTRASDAADEAFARAYALWHRVSRMESPAGWVYVVALNHARSELRRASRERMHADRHPVAVTVPGPEPDGPVWQALRTLSPRARLAVALRYLADLPEAEVARLMGVTRGTVATTLHRARAELADRLASQREEEIR